jgi:hypothetical protein
MSEFFEKISPYHFNNSEENISNYSLRRLTDRFNKLFPHLENKDHYFDKYGIKEPISFDFEKKYTLQEINSIKYIKLRLCDSDIWSSILSTIFKIDIVIIHDYKTEDKGIGDLYRRFKLSYNLPINYLTLIKDDKYFKFYYNEKERNDYIAKWASNLDDIFIPYTKKQYKFYINLCLENQYINDIQLDHYIDNGCFCQYCTNKRREIYFKAKNGEKKFAKIIHTDIVNEVKEQKMNIIVEKIKNVVHKKMKGKFLPNQFIINVSNK